MTNLYGSFMKRSNEYTHPLRLAGGDAGRESTREVIMRDKSFTSVFMDQYRNMLEMKGSFGLHSQLIIVCSMFTVGSDTLCKLRRMCDLASGSAVVGLNRLMLGIELTI